MHYFRDKLLGLLILSVSLLVTANENLKKDDIQGRIYGGDEAQPGKWPFFCSLAIKNFHFTNEINICGCVILGKKWVVSVTTCTKDYSAEKIYVYAGYPRATITNYKQNLRAKAKYEHPDYTPNTNDIVLVELKTEFLYSHLVLPIQLPLDDKDIVPVGTECAIMGFGETEFEQGERRKLQQGFLKVVTKTDCLFTYGSIIRDSHICGNHPTEITGLCRGDTGSPLACFDEKKQEYILRGVASFGTSVCGINSAPEVWTRISYYVKWIRDTVIECDLPTLPANAFTNSTNHHGGKFKVGEKMLLFCEKGYQHRKGATQSTCRMSGLFDKIDIDCIPKSTYSEWKIGTCSVTCGEGTRMDTRDCLDGICIENLHRVAPCRLHACPDGKDVCVSLKCSSDATCEKFFDSENFHCHCLPEFVGNGKECKRKPDEKEFGSENTNDLAVYTGWTLGECRGKCGTGKRNDFRRCIRGSCKEELSRTVDCELPNSCEKKNDDECSKLSLNCHKQARCIKIEKAVDFVCECVEGFFGNGKICGINNSVKCSMDKVVFILMMILAYFLF